jgi:DNA-binding IclR family transcriptional regulator
MAKKLPTIQVIDRASRLLDAITRNDQPVTLKILSIETGLHPATAFRILGSMTNNGFVERDERGRYRLGVRFHTIDSRVQTDASLRREAYETMKHLRDATGETVNLSVRDGNHLVYIERMLSERPGDTDTTVGKRMPLHASAVGKLMLGNLGEAFCRDYANSKDFVAFTEQTITDYERLHKEVNTAMQMGYATDMQESEAERGCLGVLITDSAGVLVAGLSISAPIDRIANEPFKHDCVGKIKDAAHKLSQRLGYTETAAA